MAICARLSKLCLSLLSVFFLIVGAGLLSLGAYVFNKYVQHGYGVLTLGPALLPALILMAVGLLGCLLGIIGFITIIRTQKCVTGMFFSLLLITFLGVIVGAALIYLNRDSIKENMHMSLMDGLDKYLNDTQVQTDIDLLQSDIQCCGVDNYTDWLKTPWYKNQSDHSHEYPESCCVLNNCSYNEHHDNLYTMGCYTKLDKTLTRNVIVISSVAGGFASILLIGMLCSLVLLLNKRRDCQEVQYIGIPEPDGMTV